jgi:hypothetical protein
MICHARETFKVLDLAIVGLAPSEKLSSARTAAFQRSV